MNVTSFDSTKDFIFKMLDDVGAGKTQLPDFQRGWIWDDDHIKSLIASLSLSFPIGAIMTLETGGDANFKPRPVEGTDPNLPDIQPEILILDGQQRLTSLFQSLRAGQAVKTKDAKGNTIHRWYYLDMKECVSDDSDREEAVKSVPEDRLIKTFRGETTTDLSSPEKEYAEDMFPLHQIFDASEWMKGYIEYWQLDRDKWNLYNEFNEHVIKHFQMYQVPVITLDKKTPKEAVCLVFEKVNQGGVPLNVFELLTASFAADDFRLREDWAERESRLKETNPSLRRMENTLFLQALTLLATKAGGRVVSCRRRDILNLTVGEYKTWADKVEEGFKRAAHFLQEQNIFNARDLPYQTQVVPIAAILTELGHDGDSQGSKQKLAQWYWCGVFGEMYGGATETRFANDFVEVSKWIKGESGEPRTIQEANFQANRLLTLRTRISAAYKGVHALLMRDGSRDFRTGSTVENQTSWGSSIDIHHIFPRAWCRDKKISPQAFESIINKTAISAVTNRMIGGRAPSVYLRTLQRSADIDPAQMDEILLSHRILPEALRADDFDRLLSVRAESLLKAIESAMGKTISREEGQTSSDKPDEDYEDGSIIWEDEATN